MKKTHPDSRALNAVGSNETFLLTRIPMSDELKGKAVAILATDRFEQADH
jgi:hypothetical protein